MLTKSSWAIWAWGNARLNRLVYCRTCQSFNIVVMNIVYLHQTYLLTLESISWNNNLEYPLGDPGQLGEL